MKAAITNVALGLLVFAVTSCRQNPPASEVKLGPDVVAVVAGRPVTRAALERELARRGPRVTKEAALDDLIRFEATLAQVRASGFDQDPATVSAIERLLVARFEERELAAAEAPSVTAAEVGAAYAAEAAHYALPAAVRGGVIFLKSSPKAASGPRMEVKQRAEQLRVAAAATDAAGFERLVRENSEDQSTRYHGGDTGWLTDSQKPDGWDPAMVNALLQLSKPGECAPVVETPVGFYVVRLIEAKAASTRPLAEVAPAIRHRLQQSKREQLTAAFQSRMRTGLDIRTNTAALAQTLVTVRTDSQPPGTP